MRTAEGASNTGARQTPLARRWPHREPQWPSPQRRPCRNMRRSPTPLVRLGFTWWGARPPVTAMRQVNQRSRRARAARSQRRGERAGRGGLPDQPPQRRVHSHRIAHRRGRASRDVPAFMCFGDAQQLNSALRRLRTSRRTAASPTQRPPGLQVRPNVLDCGSGRRQRSSGLGDCSGRLIDHADAHRGAVGASRHRYFPIDAPLPPVDVCG